jgi:hypothetical protein
MEGKRQSAFTNIGRWKFRLDGRCTEETKLQTFPNSKGQDKIVES